MEQYRLTKEEQEGLDELMVYLKDNEHKEVCIVNPKIAYQTINTVERAHEEALIKITELEDDNRDKDDLIDYLEEYFRR